MRLGVERQLVKGVQWFVKLCVRALKRMGRAGDAVERPLTFVFAKKQRQI